METTWLLRTFDELTAAQLYAIVELRERVFVVEQRCVYLDADGLDRSARHLWAERGGAMVAYLRILPAGLKYKEVAIGRVVTARAARGGGLGRELVRRGIDACGHVPIRISAQAHLEEWYRQLGFKRASEIYDEDGIAHIDMLRTP
ncbi:MAG TPA: GNAT family N-acetyltransferase [Kofleriaceae bacterium]|nr:GNAT family N-acetyltransferase [Kofleriaceae bacterium]